MPAPRRQIGGVTVPDTPLVAHAMDEACTVSEPYLFNHAVRSWLFAVQIADLKRLHYDEEVVAVASLLHDVGLTPKWQGERRFEVEGRTPPGGSREPGASMNAGPSSSGTAWR